MALYFPTIGELPAEEFIGRRIKVSLKDGDPKHPSICWVLGLGPKGQVQIKTFKTGGKPDIRMVDPKCLHPWWSENSDLKAKADALVKQIGKPRIEIPDNWQPDKPGPDPNLVNGRIPMPPPPELQKAPVAEAAPVPSPTSTTTMKTAPETAVDAAETKRRQLTHSELIRLAGWMGPMREKLEPMSIKDLAQACTDFLGREVSDYTSEQIRKEFGWLPRIAAVAAKKLSKAELQAEVEAQGARIKELEDWMLRIMEKTGIL